MEKEVNNKNKKYDESRVYYVYKHVRLDNNTCFYIGKGKNGRKDVPNRNPTHDSIYDRHGCKVVIFKDKLNEEEAYKLEEDLINCYVHKMGYGICIKGYMNNNNKFLTNMNWGGIGVFSGMHHSKETIQRMSESHKRENLSEETIQKMSESHKGIEQSEESKKKRSEALKGRKFSEETIQRMSESHKGKQAGENHPMWGKKGKDSPVYGEKNGMWGKTSPNKGKKGLYKHSEEAKRKMSEANSKKVICITTGETFDSMKEAGYHYNVAHGNICACCKGKIQSAGKLNGVRLQWKYLEDYNDNCLEEYKLNIGEPNSKKVICTTTGKTFNSQTEAANYYNIAQSSISSCCKGTLKHAGKLNGVKLQWKYLEDDDNDLKAI